MGSYPVEIRRCGRIRTNGTQCGSPALKGKEFCYYHDQNRPAAVELYLDGERYPAFDIVLPVFEDAHSIQTALRQVVQLMLQRRIERKDAGLLLYALQIASGNLKMMQAEKAKPTQVVVEPEKTAETPLGMTPWSASGEGHDREEDEDPTHGTEGDEWETRAPTPRERYRGLSMEERHEMRDKFRRKGLFTEQEFHDYVTDDGPDPLLLAMERLEERKQKRGPQNSETPGADALAPGGIQACAGMEESHSSQRTR